MAWIKSSRCSTSGCVEVDLPAVWRQSTRCVGGECVQVASGEDSVGMRDSKDPDSPVLVFTRGSFAAFVAGCKSGEFG